MEYFRQKRVVFIDLMENEEEKDGKSTRNYGEALFTSELIKHFVKDIQTFYSKIGETAKFKRILRQLAQKGLTGSE